MAKDQPWKAKGMTKTDWLAEEVAKAVGAGKPWKCETVDFSDPNRPPTCIEVDFPIIPINQIAAIEGNAGKPIYQMSKWWARRRSSVFRSMLLASAIKAPDDPSDAAKLVWDAYYGNHQKKGAFKDLKVADIFMGGGTTVVEGSRLGMQMYGNDLNPVAWFVVKNELAQVDKTEVEALLADIEAEVKPQIMPFYACDCPRGHKGEWTQISTGKVMGNDFDPLALMPEERKDYRYHGPEMIYAFWAKHGPCQVTGCGHRTPIMTSPVMAIKTLSVKSWSRTCKHCGGEYDIEERDARMAPGISLVVADTERPFAVAKLNKYSGAPESAECPCCGETEAFGKLGKGQRKKVELSLLVHPDWLQGEASHDEQGQPYGGRADDGIEETIRWNEARADQCRLIEVRGKLPEEIACPATGLLIKTGSEGGSSPKSGEFVCAECGTSQRIVEAIAASKKQAPLASFAIQGYCPECARVGEAYSGRFFAEATDPTSISTAVVEWNERKDSDLSEYWPRDEIPFGHMTHQRQPLPQHGYTHWWKMFNPTQLLTLASLIKISVERGSEEASDFVLGAVQQFIRNANMLCFWHKSHDHFAPALSNNNFHPKSTCIEVSAFSQVGYGPWYSVIGALGEGLLWKDNPWEIVSNERLSASYGALAESLSGKGEKVLTRDPVNPNVTLRCASATDQSDIASESVDLVVTDPPFGGLLHYSELADFFYVWIRLALRKKYPPVFRALESPKTLEAVANKARNADDSDEFYQKILTESWKEAWRILRPSGILAFTFHHSEDAPWVSVLESLFDAGFYLEATYPIRSDETKGTGQFGSKLIEYDIIHVCRKRHKEPKAISWPKLRRQVLQDVRDLQDLLEHHQEEGLPEADVQVIRRGKALEYFSRHYGKVYKDQDTPMTVLEALLGINQLLDEEAGGIKEAPPHNAEPFTRMLLRLFDGIRELPRDQMQKFLRGTGSTPSDFVDRGWVFEERKVFYLTSPLDIAQAWVGRHRRAMYSDYDQAMFLIGACFEGSGINASETLNNENFKPHPALGAILTWFKTHGADSPVRNAATTAAKLYHTWESRNQGTKRQLEMFETLGEEA